MWGREKNVVVVLPRESVNILYLHTQSGKSVFCMYIAIGGKAFLAQESFNFLLVHIIGTQLY